jgi:sulfite exporter TauE/SafE
VTTKWRLLALFCTGRVARYSVIGSVAGALGVLAASIPEYLTGWAEISRTSAMQLMFALYAVLEAIALMLYRPLSPAIEAAVEETPKAPLQQSRRLVYGLAALFGMDSFGTGFLVQSLLALTACMDPTAPADARCRKNVVVRSFVFFGGD